MARPKQFLNTSYYLLKYLAAVLSILLVSSCSSSVGSKGKQPTESPTRSLSGVEVDLFTAKAFLGGSDYERYHIKDGVIWRECGQVDPKRKRASQKIEGDDVLDPDPNLVVRERRVENLSSKTEAAIRQFATSFLTDVAKSQRKPPLPGSVFSVTEPGIFELTVTVDGQKQRLVTSVDAISDDDKREITVSLGAAYKLFEGIRGVGPIICEASTFFGVGRGSL